MKLDLSEEFRTYKEIEFDNEVEQFEYVMQKVIDGIRNVVPAALDAIDAAGVKCPALDRMPETLIEQHLTQRLVTLLIGAQGFRINTQVQSELVKRISEHYGAEARR